MKTYHLQQGSLEAGKIKHFLLELQTARMYSCNYLMLMRLRNFLNKRTVNSYNLS